MKAAVLFHANSQQLFPARYELLDGLRGIAALLVVLNHLGVVSGAIGHFAVMVFFVISGYCIAAAADSAARNGLSFKQFMERRIARIFPPYLLAVGFFVLTRVIKTVITGHDYLHWSVLAWIQNLTLTQWIWDVYHPVVSPIQNPTLFVAAFWSLNYEEQFYLVMAGALVLASRRAVPLVAPIVTLAAVAVLWNWLIPGGWICGFFIEYWAHFALGSCLFFVLSKYSTNGIRALFVCVLIALGSSSLARVLLHTGAESDSLRAMTELSFLSVVTLILFFVRPLSQLISQSKLWRPFAALGTVSYSLYLIHQFNLNLVLTVATRVIPQRAPYALLIVTELTLFLALATVFWRLCERPFLPRRLARGPVEELSLDGRPA